MNNKKRFANRIHSVSRDKRYKFANITFCGINYEKLEYDKLRNELPLSSNKSEVGSLIDVKHQSKISSHSKMTAPTYDSNPRNPLKSLLEINIAQKAKNNSSERETLADANSHDLLQVKREGVKSVEPPSKEGSPRWIHVYFYILFLF